MTNARSRVRRFAGALKLVAVLAAFAGLPGGRAAMAADHGDSPNVAHDQGADIADVFAFLDPNDNTRVIIAATFHGFIVPGEAVNFGIFDPNLRYRFEIENTGDAEPDEFIDVRFSQRTATSEAQTATVTLPFGGRRNRGFSFAAPATNPTQNATAPDPVITPEPTTGVQFFAGLVDDPFFFDIPAFSRFIASVRAGSPDATHFNRGRDTFAGYNILCIALSVPANLLQGQTEDDQPNNVLGVGFATQRGTTSIGKRGVIKGSKKFRNADRMGNPAVNVALVPFARKNEYNFATPEDDADGEFAPDIVANLQSLGTNEANINVLAGVAVTNGDLLRLNLTTPNTGPGGGTNAPASYPNGRRPADDTIDILLTIIANGNDLGDNVDANDKPLRDAFPFFAPPHQPREPGTVDDQTRN